MKITDINIGDYVLVQRGLHIREHATVRAVTDQNTVIVKLTDGRREETHPDNVLKNFTRNV